MPGTRKRPTKTLLSWGIFMFPQLLWSKQHSICERTKSENTEHLAQVHEQLELPGMVWLLPGLDFKRGPTLCCPSYLIPHLHWYYCSLVGTTACPRPVQLAASTFYIAAYHKRHPCLFDLLINMISLSNMSFSLYCLLFTICDNLNIFHAICFLCKVFSNMNKTGQPHE